MKIERVHLQAICPALGAKVDEWVEPINAALDAAQCNTLDRAAMFLAQARHESAQFTTLEENLNYSSGALVATFPKYFTTNEAHAYERQPQRIANRVYAGRMGNGDEASGDGWKFHGRGLIQITGRAMYRACSEGLQQPLLDRPELLLDPELAALSAAWYWTVNDCNLYADRNNFVKVTEIVNGGRNGLVDRQRYLETCLRILEQRTTTSAS